MDMSVRVSEKEVSHIFWLSGSITKGLYYTLLVALPTGLGEKSVPRRSCSMGLYAGICRDGADLSRLARILRRKDWIDSERAFDTCLLIGAMDLLQNQTESSMSEFTHIS